MTVATLTLETFSGAVGEAYEVEAGGAAHALTLVSATPLANSGREGGSFRLEFQGSAETVLPQAIYGFRREGFAEEIFIVPIARDAQGTRYEAVFF